jgi:hypothetical protein
MDQAGTAPAETCLGRQRHSKRKPERGCGVRCGPAGRQYVAGREYRCRLITRHHSSAILKRSGARTELNSDRRHARPAGCQACPEKRSDYKDSTQGKKAPAAGSKMP